MFLDGADARPEVRDDFAEPLYGLIAEVSRSVEVAGGRMLTVKLLAVEKRTRCFVETFCRFDFGRLVRHNISYIM